MSSPLRLLRHRAMQRFWQRVHRVSLIGMNYWASHLAHTGELDAIAWVARRLRDTVRPVIFDVGANVGDYAQACLAAFPAGCDLHAFEPARATHAMLQRRFAQQKDRVHAHCCAMGESMGSALLRSSEPGSTIASLVDLQSPIRPFDPALAETVTVATIDGFCAENGIDRIDFLKLDVEGYELAVLKGAAHMIGREKVSIIQMEFGENNISSRSYMADFVKCFDGYDMFRIVPGGLVPWTYDGGRSEIFATMNYLCVARHFSDRSDP